MLCPTLFDTTHTIPRNLISHGGEAIYHAKIFEESFADHVYEKLLHEVDWRPDEWVIYNKEYLTRRKVYWYSKRRAWPQELLIMKEKVEALTGARYTNVLLNLYESGEVGLGWHADKESRSENASIASVSLGAERRFDLRHNDTGEKVSIILEHGSLLEMKGDLQHFWKHHVPKAKKILHPRINLTFRT